MKTPEELAEEHGNSVETSCCGTSDIIIEAEKSFLAGYQAAQDHNPDASKMVWISVKDRLPKIPENDRSNRVLLLRADGFIVIARVEKCLRFVSPLQEALIVETDNGDPIEEFTHWMPLPKSPEE